MLQVRWGPCVPQVIQETVRREDTPGKDGKGPVGSFLSPRRLPSHLGTGLGQQKTRGKATEEGCLMPLHGESESWGPDDSTAAVLPKPRDVEKRAGGHSRGTQSWQQLSRQKRDHPWEWGLHPREHRGLSGSWGAASHCCPPFRYLSSELWFPGRGGRVLMWEAGSGWHRAAAPFPREWARLLPPADVQRSTGSVHSGNVYWLAPEQWQMRQGSKTGPAGLSVRSRIAGRSTVEEARDPLVPCVPRDSASISSLMCVQINYPGSC